MSPDRTHASRTRPPWSAALAVWAAAAIGAPVLAHQAHPSDAGPLSALPVAMSVATPALLLSGGAMLTVVAVEASATGTVWVFERASDGSRFSLTLASAVAGGSLLAVGTAVSASAISTGWILSAAGRVLAFIPNEIGKALLHNERVTR